MLCEYGSDDRARTYHMTVNSRLFYLLNYIGIGESPEARTQTLAGKNRLHHRCARDPFGTDRETRTRTVRFLRPFSLPFGVRQYWHL